MLHDRAQIRASRESCRIPPARRRVVSDGDERAAETLRTNSHAFKGLR